MCIRDRDKLVLGQSAALTGPAAQLGIQFHQGAKLYLDHVNAQGGVLRKQIVIRQLDDGYEPDRCVANTKQLIDEDVFALFGYIGTPTSVAAPVSYTHLGRQNVNRHVEKRPVVWVCTRGLGTGRFFGR